MTPFCFEHVFLASRANLFDAYFDPRHLVEQDRALDVSERQVIELVDDGDQICRRCRVVPRKQVPALLRPVCGGTLSYEELAVGRRAAGDITIDIRLLGDRGRIRACYELRPVAPGSVLRRYSGHVSVDVALVGARIERGIVAEFERSLARTAACTQSWLDQQTHLSVAARA